MNKIGGSLWKKVILVLLIIVGLSLASFSPSAHLVFEKARQEKTTD